MVQDQLISPSHFGVSEMNTMIVFFKTEQEVGSLMNLEAQVWVQAPGVIFHELLFIPSLRRVAPIHWDHGFCPGAM